EPGIEDELDVDGSGGTVDAPVDLVDRCARVVAPRHEVDEAERPGLREEQRLEDVGVRVVALEALEWSLGGADGHLSASASIQNAREDARAVEPRHAEPIEGPVDRDERRGRAIPDDASCGDRDLRWVV